MKPGRAHSSTLLLVRLLALAISLTLGAAHANDYSDVAQLLREGKLAEAQTRVDRHLAAQPRDPQMRLFKGVIQRESGRPADAIATFTRLSEDHPELPEPYNNLAVIHAAQGQYDKARIALEKALRTNPSYATAHENLADVYARLASQAYSKALQLDGVPQPGPARLTLIRELSPAPASPARPVLAAAPSTAASKPVVPAQAKPAVVAAAPAPTKPAAATAAVPAPSATPPQPAAADSSNREVELAVRAGARAWTDKNMTQYLAAYDKSFETPGQQSRSAWEQDRRLRITGKSRISVNLLELQITVKGNRAVAKFRQDYKADALAVLSRKTLELVRTGDRWLIVKEASGG
ncbi:MAG: tetratricopeptide repeat protein [Burkholderiales bacterium]|nr:tetratricopeptide repeat protein [Burkholderiales bacterium]